MSHETCWTLILSAGAGDQTARTSFTQRYLPIVRGYLAARWRGTASIGDLDDAVQEVFVECLRTGGALVRAAPGRGAGFRAFLYGVVQKTALHFERARARRGQRAKSGIELDGIASQDDSWATIFDRTWARAVMREAADLQVTQAKGKGDAAVRRAELLRLRFHDGLPIREIARLWAVDAARVHHEYAKAREEFATALRLVVADHHAGPQRALEAECGRLLSMLGEPGQSRSSPRGLGEALG
jgi:RNA polymerase sigma-70 factor (ECF subfamily)